MNQEDNGPLPVPQPSAESTIEPALSAGMSTAMQWGATLGPEKLEIAFKDLEPQLKRDHQALMARIEMQRSAAERADAAAAEVATREAQDKQHRRKHIQHMSGFVGGAVIAISVLAGGVYATKDTR
ncbi:hypothetical protein OHS81_24200 [Streptomyces sp. NBC_00400]|uniref:hypothetical protein n=1 Tax=Streptomyces sp. NBC_00400 TaxID=2975737 RepID=UPI002E1D484B